MNRQLPLATYRALFERWLAAEDDLLTRETLLLDVSELAKELLPGQISVDELMSLHHQTQALVAESLVNAPAGSAAARAHHRLATGDAVALQLALLLPLQLHEQGRADQAEELLRQHDKLRAVATLAAGVAHDFNNLLGSIIGLTELCQLQAVAGSAQARNLEGILQAGHRAAGLVGELLSFAREQPLRLQPVPLGALLERCQPLLAASLPRGVGLQIDLRADSLVQADPAQLEQVLLNLVKNAGYAQRDRGGLVRVVADHAPLHGQVSAARLQVIDQGEGIPADVLPHIFDPFFTTKPVGVGTGLGLSAAHGIVRHHGGELDVRSRPGQGTRFRLRLPRTTA